MHEVLPLLSACLCFQSQAKFQGDSMDKMDRADLYLTEAEIKSKAQQEVSRVKSHADNILQSRKVVASQL